MTEYAWHVDLTKFRVYLRQKYDIQKAYYYLGYIQDDHKIEQLYEEVQNASFTLVFRQHNSVMVVTKKGNVDPDIIFDAMRRIQAGGLRQNSLSFRRRRLQNAC